MKQLLALLLLGILSKGILAAPTKSSDTQTDYERSIESVVRNKYFYKKSKIEIGALAGVMPYDSVVSHFLVGGKATWHFSDHFGWEIADIQLGLPSITADIKDKVKAKNLGNVQFSQITLLATTNLLVSPIYGKIRFFGNQVLYFDIYLVVGGGVANTKTIKLSNSSPTETTLRNGMEPVFDFGLGFKIFTNDAMSLIIDLRDYVTLAEVYSSKKPRSNFSVLAGLSFFLPTF